MTSNPEIPEVPSPKFPYEENSEQATAPAWKCRGCGRLWLEEHMARYCCCTDRACACGNRMSKFYIRCDVCLAREREEKWLAKPEVAWDGEFPLGNWDGDDYWFDEDSLLEFIGDRDDGWNGLKLTDCSPERPPSFDMDDFLNDHTGPEWDGFGKDADEINGAVNRWIKEHAPKMFNQTGRRLSLKSVLEKLGVKRCCKCGHTVDSGGDLCDECLAEIRD